MRLLIMIEVTRRLRFHHRNNTRNYIVRETVSSIYITKILVMKDSLIDKTKYKCKPILTTEWHQKSYYFLL